MSRGNTEHGGTPGRKKCLEAEESGVPSSNAGVATDQRRGGKDPGDREPLIWWRASKGKERLGGESGVGESRRSAGNQANPMTGCRVQQTCEAVCGASRRSREERQGRNKFGCGNPEPRATESGRIRGCWWRGGSLRKSKRGAHDADDFGRRRTRAAGEPAYLRRGGDGVW
jgi:hypothetical protein